MPRLFIADRWGGFPKGRAQCLSLAVLPRSYESCQGLMGFDHPWDDHHAPDYRVESPTVARVANNIHGFNKKPQRSRKGMGPSEGDDNIRREMRQSMLSGCLQLREENSIKAELQEENSIQRIAHHH